MPSVFLAPHPESPSHPVERIEVVIVRSLAGGLSLTYRVAGNINGLLIPAPQTAARADGLWRHACLEAFVDVGNGAYREFNFSPSGLWQAYEFSAYRAGGLMTSAADPRITSQLGPRTLSVSAKLHADDLPPASAALRLGLSAVIEAADGTISYWALRHAPGKPDFHHPDTFALELFPCP